MTLSIGFLLITHTQPDQVRRLIHRLNAIFDQPSIVCHHDFAQSNLPIEECPGNVSFVLPHHPTGWGIFSTVEATVHAIRQMYEAPASPDWFVLLSGADYPIKSAVHIRRDLASLRCDACIEYGSASVMTDTAPSGGCILP